MALCLNYVIAANGAKARKFFHKSGGSHFQPNQNFGLSRIFFLNVEDNDPQITKSGPDFRSDHWNWLETDFENFSHFF